MEPEVHRVHVATGIELECVVKRGSTDIGAVICHPYGKLGGDLHNNVVVALARALDREGITTCRVNLRGVGRSDGNTSWRGVQEVDDVVAVAKYLCCLPGDESMPCPTRIILIGYSHGSIFTTAAGEREELFEAIGTVAVAYPFGPMSHLFALLRHLAPKPVPRLPSFNIIGTRDNFSSVSNWSKRIPEDNPPRHASVVVDGYDHFWIGHEDQVTKPVVEWINLLLKLNM